MKYSFNEQSSFMKIQLFSFKSAAKYNENSDDNSDNIIIKSVVESNEHSIGDFFLVRTVICLKKIQTNYLRKQQSAVFNKNLVDSYLVRI